MDFIPEQEISELLLEHGITSRPDGDACILLEMDANHAGVRECLFTKDVPCDECDGWSCRSVDSDSLISSVLHAVKKIHQWQIAIIPTGKWRSVFDAVAFSLTEDEGWQEFDASATIRLNTRDPLLFEVGDEHTLIGLLTALMNDGETIEQSVFLLPVGAPVLVHIHPGGPMKFWFGNSVLADEISESYTE